MRTVTIIIYEYTTRDDGKTNERNKDVINSPGPISFASDTN